MLMLIQVGFFQVDFWHKVKNTAIFSSFSLFLDCGFKEIWILVSDGIYIWYLCIYLFIYISVIFIPMWESGMLCFGEDKEGVIFFYMSEQMLQFLKRDLCQDTHTNKHTQTDIGFMSLCMHCHQDLHSVKSRRQRATEKQRSQS